MTDQCAEEKRWVFSFDLKEESEDGEREDIYIHVHTFIISTSDWTQH